MGKYGVIDFDEDEIEAAGHWYHDRYLATHGGYRPGYEGSMLYAIMDRGALVGVDDKIRRAKRLEKEAQDAARVAATQAKKATGGEKKELLADVKGLRSIARKARQLVLSETEKPRVHATKKGHHVTKKVPGNKRKKTTPTPTPTAQIQRQIEEVVGPLPRYASEGYQPSPSSYLGGLRYKADLARQEREASERQEMGEQLARAGFDSKLARQLQQEGMGPFELSSRLSIPSGVGSLQYTHGFTKRHHVTKPRVRVTQAKRSSATTADRKWLAEWARKVAGRSLDARDVAVDADRTFDVLAHERPQVAALRSGFVDAVMNLVESRKYLRAH